ncbi:SET domain-containing protein [Rutstroemia sp. NJR-2017a BVV2]|nr:SET domain-containing protein [Rutstroemia sp. NJR-2017a BVV2]
MHFSSIFSAACLLAYANANTSSSVLGTVSLIQGSTTSFSFPDSICPAVKFQGSTAVLSSIPFHRSLSLPNEAHNNPATSSPWQYPPSCANVSSRTSLSKDVFCTFTSTSFASGRGISILTTPRIAKRIAASPVFTFRKPQPPLFSASNPPLFEVRHMTGRGMGVVANRTIQRGDRLFAYPVIGIFHNDAFVKKDPVSYKEHVKLFEKAVTQLPPSTAEKLWALGAHETNRQGQDGEGVIGRLNTNTFGEQFIAQDHSIVVPETARMNHDCRPNANYYLDPLTLTHYTHAARTIHPGEEVTITYTDPLQPHSIRQHAIHHSWGFHCTCSLCSSPPTHRALSNSRIQKINSLLQELSSFRPPYPISIQHHIAKAQQLISLYELERLETHIGDGYREAAYAYASAGKEWEARRYAELGVQAGVVAEGWGERWVRGLEGMRTGEGVRGHWSWGVGVRGREG